MEFRDIPFPECIAMGAQSDPMWETTVVTSFGGSEQANQNWEDARHRFDVSFAVRNATDHQLVRAHFHQVRGRAFSFPFKDFLDFEVSADHGAMVDENSGWQMHKRYGDLPYAYDRRITRPVQGTVVIYRIRNGSTTVATADATIDHETGFVLMANHQSDDDYQWSGEFVVPCRYDTDRLPAVAINREPGAQGELLVQCDAIPIVEVRE